MDTRGGSPAIHRNVRENNLVRSCCCVNTQGNGGKGEEERGKELHHGGVRVSDGGACEESKDPRPGPDVLLYLRRFACCSGTVIDVRHCLRSRMARRHSQPM